MWIYIWDTEIKWIYLWDTPVKEVYLWDTKIRPKPMPAWIYHNATLWLISLSSDGSNWLTIADKNLWATTVWNSWDTLSQANCWNFYQRGNNRGFPYSWWISKSSTRVNAGSYWPWNYYSSSTFITDYSYWDSSFNSNLRWGVTDTKEARQWPCPTGFYVPSWNDLTNIRDIWGGLGWWYNNGANFWKYLKMPFAWSRNYVNGNVGNKWGYWYYWSSTYSWFAEWMIIRISSGEIYPKTEITPYWLSIRPFKNEAVQPDTSWTKLY